MAKIKPGTPHPSKPGMVMGTNSRYVSKSTYAKQTKSASTAKKISKKPPQKGGAIVKKTSSAITKQQRTSSDITPSTQTRRAKAAEKLRKAQQGTRGSGGGAKPGRGVTPQPKLPPASASRTAARNIRNFASATGKSKLVPLTKGVGKVAGPLGLLLGGAATATDLKESLQRGEGFAAIPRLIKEENEKNRKKPAQTTGQNSRGGSRARGRRRTSTPTPEPTAKKSNVHPDTKARQAKKRQATDNQIRINAKLENTRKELARRKKLRQEKNNQPRTAETAPARPPVQASRQPTTTTSAPTKKSNASTYKAHGSALHVGRHKTLAEHRAAVKARKAGKSKPVSAKTTGPSKNDVQRLTGGSTPKQGAEASAAIKRLKKKTVKQRLGKTVPTSKIPPTNAPASVMRKYLADLEAGRLTR